jgi:hypothetical protein
LGGTPIVIETAEPRLTWLPAAGFWESTVPRLLQELSTTLPQAQMGGAFEATAGADAATIRPTTPTVSMAASRASHRDRRMTFIAFLLNPKRSR